MSNRILALGIADSVHRVTPATRPKPRKRRIGILAATIGWLALIVGVLAILRAFA